jgi:STE24 endopeptidase
MFGVETGATYAGFVLAGLWLGPVSQLLAPLDNRLSIRHEYEADAFAVEIMGDGETVRDALRTIAGENLSNPFPHPIYEAFHYDHPPLAERLRAIRAEAGASASGPEGPEAPEAT